jgi:hypothetical protein
MIIIFKIYEKIKNLNSNFYKWFGDSEMKDYNGDPIIFIMAQQKILIYLMIKI